MQPSMLKLLAADAEGLGVVAAAVQDALTRPQDLSLDRKSRTFGLALNRFQWERAGAKPPYFRSRAVLAFTGVLAARQRNLPRGVDDVLSVLDVTFVPGAEPPTGKVSVTFAGGGQLELDVECLDVTLVDTGAAWPTRRKPDHDKLAGAAG